MRVRLEHLHRVSHAEIGNCLRMARPKDIWMKVQPTCLYICLLIQALQMHNTTLDSVVDILLAKWNTKGQEICGSGSHMLTISLVPSTAARFCVRTTRLGLTF